MKSSGMRVERPGALSIVVEVQMSGLESINSVGGAAVAVYGWMPEANSGNGGCA